VPLLLIALLWVCEWWYSAGQLAFYFLRSCMLLVGCLAAKRCWHLASRLMDLVCIVMLSGQKVHQKVYHA
jgi:hypothetical protein